MIRNFRAFQSSIFLKMALAFLVVLAPLYVLTWIVGEKGKTSIRNELSHTLENQIHHSLQSIEQEVNRIVQLQREYILDKDLLELSTVSKGMTAFERNQAVLSLQRRLYIMQVSSTYIEEASAFIPEIDRTISGANYDTGIDAEQWNALRDPMLRTGPFTFWSGRLYLTLQYPNPNPAPDEKNVFLLSARLSDRNLRNVLQDLISHKDRGAAFVNLSRDWVLSGDSGGAEQELSGNIEAFVREKQAQGIRLGVENVKWSGITYTVSFETSAPLRTTLIAYVPDKQILGPIHTYSNWMRALFIGSLFIIMLFSLAMYRLIHKPLHRLVHSFRQMEQGNMDIRLGESRKDEFGYLYHRFNQMVSEVQRLIMEVYEQRILTQQSELKRLQSQINPHFLYNSMFVLYQYIQAGENEAAYRFAKYLGEYFRYITRDKSDEVRLRVEVEQARTYVEINKMSYDHRLHVDFDELPASWQDTMVPRLILQPIIENAFKYALEHKISGARLSIVMEGTEDACMIAVEDNGERLSEEALTVLSKKLEDTSMDSGESVGLGNVHRRLQIKYGPESGLFFSRSELGGLKVRITIKPTEV